MPNTGYKGPPAKKLPSPSTLNANKINFNPGEILNLSGRNLSKNEENLLSLGLKFIPSTHKIAKSEIYKSFSQLVRRIRLFDYFQNKKLNRTEKIPFTRPSHWNPPLSSISEKTNKLIAELKKATAEALSRYPSENGFFINKNHKDNLNKDLRSSLQILKNDENIVIKPADKGGKVCILNRLDYINEAERQLNNNQYYRQIEARRKTEIIPKINATLNSLSKNSFIENKQHDYLLARPEDRDRYFYLLPKIHKPKEKWPSPHMPEGRPIVGDCATENRRVCDYIDSFLKPLATNHTSYLKDTYDFIGKIRDVRVDPDWILVTGDITSLYTNMCIERILLTVETEMRKHPDPSRPDREILDLLKLTLENNDFEFNNKIFLQIYGTAMGYPYAPNLANIFLLDFDQKLQNEFKIKPLFYFRFLDDIFFIWPGTVEDLGEFETYMNGLIPNIKVTLTHNNNEIPFLDTTVFKHTNQDTDSTSLQTRVFFKETDSHQLLHCKSFHPNHTHKGILKSQFIRFKRLSSFKADYDRTCSILFKAIKHRGYSARLFRHYKNGVWHNRLPPKKHKKGGPTLPIVIKYSPISTKISRVWRKIVAENELFKNHTIITAYERNRNLGEILAPTRLRPLGDIAPSN